MKTTALLFVTMVLVQMQSFAQCANQLNIYSFTWGGKNYEVVKEMQTWSNAASCAVERGGYLAEINDLEEQNAVYDAIINGAGVSPTYTSVPNGGGIAYIWIGATDQAEEGTWLWDGNNDGTGINFWFGQGANGSGNGGSVGGAYFNWGGTSTGTPKEPDNYGSGQDHAAIGLAGWPSGTNLLGIAGEWNDIIGSSALYYVIEKESGVGINNGGSEHKFRVFPNPIKNKLCVEGDCSVKNHGFKILDYTGRTIMHGYFENDNNEIYVEALPKGIYFLKIDGESLFTFKFIKS